MVAADGADGEDSGGSGGGDPAAGKVLLSLHRPGPITSASVDDPQILMIPVAAVGLGDTVLWNIKLLTPPGAGETCDWEISHISSTGSMAIAWGTISGTNTSATTCVETWRNLQPATCSRSRSQRRRQDAQPRISL